MRKTESLAKSLSGLFNTPFSDLPKDLGQRVKQDLFPLLWDGLTPFQRENAALQWDYCHDLTTEKVRHESWELFPKRDKIKSEINKLELLHPESVTEVEDRDRNINELKAELANLPTPLYIPYSQAIKQLDKRLNATHEELAAWIWLASGEGCEGLKAYLNANEIDPPEDFFYEYDEVDHDYLGPLMYCWFRAIDIADFTPSERFITGNELIKRWSAAGIQPEDYIRARIAESRLVEIHPITGGSQGRFPENDGFPPLGTGLFTLSSVEGIEAEEPCIKNDTLCKHQPAEPRPDIGTSSPFKCITNPPSNTNDWFLAIRDMSIDFHKQNGRCPNETEAWSQLYQSPPASYGITAGKDKGEESVFMNGGSLGRRAFLGRWRRYTKPAH